MLFNFFLKLLLLDLLGCHPCSALAMEHKVFGFFFQHHISRVISDLAFKLSRQELLVELKIGIEHIE